MQVNGSGTATAWANVDLTGVVPKTYMGASNGVASLDSTGRLPNTQLPTTLVTESIYHKEAGPVINTDFTIKRMWKDHIQVTGMSIRTGSGTCNVQLLVGGVLKDSARAASVTTSDITFTSPVDVDATSASLNLGFQVTSGATPTDVEVTFSVAAVT